MAGRQEQEHQQQQQRRYRAPFLLFFVPIVLTSSQCGNKSHFSQGVSPSGHPGPCLQGLDPFSSPKHSIYTFPFSNGRTDCPRVRKGKLCKWFSVLLSFGSFEFFYRPELPHSIFSRFFNASIWRGEFLIFFTPS